MQAKENTQNTAMDKLSMPLDHAGGAPAAAGVSRAASFAILGVVYLIAAAAGLMLYRALHFVFWLNLLLADVLATVIVFAFSLLLHNASVYDPYWSVQPIVILTALALSAPLTPVRALPLAAVWIWGLRLTANWAYTFHGLGHQDWRYTMLREKTGALYPAVNLCGIHLVPTLVVYACTLPAATLFQTMDAVLTPAGVLFFFVSVAAAVWQGTADVQMHRFRSGGGKGFIRTGLWKYTRHPNYLGEIVMWWGVALYAVCALPGHWIFLAGAAANTLMFLCISIPLADGRQGQKPGFTEYRRETRMLLPIPKRQ